MKKTNDKNLIDKKMSSGGKDSPRLDMKQYIKLAEKDPEALRFDLESEITNLLKEKFKQEGKPGESFLDYINRYFYVKVNEESIPLEIKNKRLR